MSLQFEAIGNLNSVPMIGDNDSLVVMTASGPRRILKSALTAGLAAQIPAVSEWDGASTEVTSASITLGAYGFRSVFSAANAAIFGEATLDNTNFNASFVTPATMPTVQRKAFRFNGTLPKTGKYWLTINADFTGLSSGASAILYILSDIGVLAQNGTGTRTGLLISTTTLNPLVENGVTNPGSIDISASPLKSVLVCFDIDNNQIRYGSNGTTYTIQMLASAPLAGRALCGLISAGTTDTSKTIKAIFNNTNGTTSPVTIPSGFNGLQLVNAVLPTYATTGSGIRSTTSTSYQGQYINAYDLYIITSDRLALVPDIYKTPQLVSQNTFTKSQIVNGQQFGYDGWNWISQAPSDGFAAASLAGAGTMTNNIVTGIAAGNKLTAATGNVLFGNFVLAGVTSASYNIGIGISTLSSALLCTGNVGIGMTAGGTLIGSTYSVAVGYQALNSTGHNGYSVTNCVAVGNNSLSGWIDSAYDGTTLGSATIISGAVAVGANAACANGVSGSMPIEIVAVGDQALYGTPGAYNVAVGSFAGSNGINSSNGVMVGAGAFASGTGGYNVAIGYSAAQSAKQTNSVAVGNSAMMGSVDAATGSASNNTAVGNAAMQSYSGKNSTGLGAYTLGSGTWTNATAVGYSATVTGDNQVQLGNSSTTTYVYGTVQSRSDARDKTQIRDTRLGMKFLLALRPVDYKWDMREDYLDLTNRPVPPLPVGAEPPMPVGDPTIPGFSDRLVQWKHQHDAWVAASQKYRLDMDVYTAAMIAWNIKNDISKVVHDGSHTRKRFHHGFIAQEVKATADRLGIDFGGYQDHSLKSGKDVKSIGYEEMVAPLVKGFQELHAYLHSEEYAGYLLDKMVEVQKKRQAAAAS